jgi:chaperonin GroES
LQKLALAGKECQSPPKRFHRPFKLREVQQPDSSAGGLRMKLVPLEDRVVVKLVEREDKTSSGIVLPDTAQEKPQKATVVAAGPGKYDNNGALVPMPVKKGDLVLFAKYSGAEIKLDGEEYLVLRASDIIGVLRKG